MNPLEQSIKAKLKTAINETFINRDTKINIPILSFDTSNLQKYWESHLRQVKNSILPEKINNVIDIINKYIGHILN